MTLKKIEHTFSHPQLSYDAQPNTQPCIKLTFYFKKLPEVSHEHFYGHWSTVHADLTVAAKGFGLCNIQRYVQVSQTPEMRAKAKEIAGLQVLDFDGCSEMWVKSWDDYVQFSSSKEFAAVLGPDCTKFMEMPISFYVGQENLIFGKATPGLGDGGTDGILKSSSSP